MEKLTIELKFYADTPEQLEAIIEMAKMTAKHLLTGAMLAAGKRQPEVALSCRDFFSTQREIELAEDYE
jgi:hypothetical protein